LQTEDNATGPGNTFPLALQVLPFDPGLGQIQAVDQCVEHHPDQANAIAACNIALQFDFSVGTGTALIHSHDLSSVLIRLSVVEGIGAWMKNFRVPDGGRDLRRYLGD
jgi:hypothetical protein